MFLVIQELRLPSEVSRMGAEDQMVLAEKLEERNCLQAEIDPASRRYRALLYEAHRCELRTMRLCGQRDAIQQDAIQNIQVFVDKHRSQEASCAECNV
jgi:hypothetical protein